MSKRRRSWLEGLGEAFQAMRADPLLLAPALVVILMAAAAAFLAWQVV